jgi:hypothetical protein
MAQAQTALKPAQHITADAQNGTRHKMAQAQNGTSTKRHTLITAKHITSHHKTAQSTKRHKLKTEQALYGTNGIRHKTAHDTKLYTAQNGTQYTNIAILDQYHIFFVILFNQNANSY